MSTKQTFTPSSRLLSFLSDNKKNYRYLIIVKEGFSSKSYIINLSNTTDYTKNVDITIDLSKKTYDLHCFSEGSTHHKGNYYDSNKCLSNNDLIDNYICQAIDKWNSYYLD